MRASHELYINAYPRTGIALIRATHLLPPVVLAASLPQTLSHVSSIQERARPVDQFTPAPQKSKKK